MISARRARILAVIFLFAGVLLGFFTTPGTVASLGYNIGLSEAAIKRVSGFFPYRFGLDIQGGTHLVYQADLGGIATPDYADSMDAVRDVVERRVNLFGVAEPLVQIEKSGADWRLIVELAGINDVGAAIRLIGETPFLEFKEQRDPKETEKIQNDQRANGPRANEDPYFKQTALTGRFVKKASIDFSSNSFQPAISLELTDEGGNMFAEITKRNVGKPLAIYLDAFPISAPIVQEEITGGRAQISGNFTPQSAKEFVGRLNAGALPVPIKLIAQQSIGASLGEASLERSLRSGLFGFLAVVLFMIFWYRLPGVISVCALLLYIALTLAVFKMIPVTLGVAGIAGFILSVGMAVDANILIFERLKEELRSGKGLRDAVREGFDRAWTSIRDSNVSSLITSVILYWLGTSVVKGFALTLGIGILISMFSAITVTRTLLIALMTQRFESVRFIFLNGFSK